MEVTMACEESAIADGTYLFTTATCPNCKIAKALLDKAGVVYETMLANEHPDMVSELGIKQAPTLVVVKDGEVHKCTGVSDIKKMLNQ
jgi:ribonucleoside-triphosphate reductase